MNDKRLKPRYGRDELPSDLQICSVKFPDGRQFPSSLLNISHLGMKIRIQPRHYLIEDIYHKGNTMELQFPIIGVEMSGTCVHTEINSDQSVSIGIFIFNPFSQQRIKEMLKQVMV